MEFTLLKISELQMLPPFHVLHFVVLDFSIIDLLIYLHETTNNPLSPNLVPVFV